MDWKERLNSIINKCFDLETYKGNTGRPLEFVTRKDITDYVESLLKEQNKWISVKDKLPTEGMNVIVYNDFGHIIVAHYWRGIWEDTIPKPNLYYFKPLYWMPLPELPEGEVK